MISRHPAVRWILVVLLIIAIAGVLFHNQIESYFITSYHPHVTRHEASGNLYKPADYNLSHAKPVTMHQVLRARLHSGQVRKVGQLMIPADHLHLPIGLGVSNNTLMLAAGTMRPHEKMGSGNYALAGHHMVNPKALFTPVFLHAKRGQSVYLTDMHNIYQYRIQLRKVVSKRDAKVVNNTRTPEVTLVTCNSSHLTSRRLVVGAGLVQKYRVSQAPRWLKKFMTRKTNNFKVLQGY